MRDLTTLVEPLRTWMTECQQSEMYTGVVERLERQLLQSKNPKKLLSKEKNHYTTILDHTGLEGRWVGFDLAKAFVKEELPDWKYRSDPSMIRAFCRSALLVDYIEDKLAKYEVDKLGNPLDYDYGPEPENIVFYEKKLNLAKLKFFIEDSIVPIIDSKYEWAALWIYLFHRGLLKNKQASAFVKQMNLWLTKPGEKEPCDVKTFSTYSRLKSLPIDEWTFQKLSILIDPYSLPFEKNTKEDKGISSEGVATMRTQFYIIKALFNEKYW